MSFKAPTHVSPEAAPAAVAGHEREHVTREQSRADREERAVVSQYVQIHTSICSECGRVYVSGGTTTTVTGSTPKDAYGDNNSSAIGRTVDATV